MINLLFVTTTDTLEIVQVNVVKLKNVALNKKFFDSTF